MLVWFYSLLSPSHHLGQNLSSPRRGCRKARKETRLVLQALQPLPPSLFLASKLQTTTLTLSRLSFSCSRQGLSGQGESVLYKQVLTTEWTHLPLDRLCFLNAKPPLLQGQCLTQKPPLVVEEYYTLQNLNKEDIWGQEASAHSATI